MSEKSKLKGKGLEILDRSDDRSALLGSLATGLNVTSYTESKLKGKGLEILGNVEVNKIKYNHPDVFERLDTEPIESSEQAERVIYEIPEVGFLSLLKIDDYDGKNVLQVEMAEVDEGKVGQGFGTDMYRYVANHLPSGYQGILSGIITHEAIHNIYETLGSDPGLSLHKIGNDFKPSMYLIEKIED